MSERNRTNRAVSAAAMEETLQLYHAWLGYLLAMQGEAVLRVKEEDIRAALKRFTCEAAKEGDEYVIRLRLQDKKEAAHG